jgi:hypothetical protein
MAGRCLPLLLHLLHLAEGCDEGFQGRSYGRVGGIFLQQGVGADEKYSTQGGHLGFDSGFGLGYYLVRRGGKPGEDFLLSLFLSLELSMRDIDRDHGACNWQPGKRSMEIQQL